MASIISQLKGTAAELASKTLGVGVLAWNETAKRWHGGDGATLGGIAMARYDERNDGSLGDSQRVETGASNAVTVDDIGKVIIGNRATAISFDLAAAATLTGKFVAVFKNIGAGAMTIVPNGTELIDGSSSAINVPTGASILIKGDGAGFRSYFNTADIANKASLTGVETLTNKTLSSPVVNAPSGEFLRGTLFGLTMANNAADIANDIDISGGFAGSDGTVPSLMTLSSSITKRMDAPWAVGSNNGGWLDGGSMPNGTGHFFLIRRSDTGVVDVGASASLNPTLPTGYDQKRRIGSIPRSGAAMKTFVQFGDYFELITPSPDVVELNPGNSAGLKALSVPLGIKVLARLAVGMRSGNGTQDNSGEVIISSPDIGDYQPIFNNVFSHALLIQTTAEGKAAAPIDVFTNTSGQVRRRLAASAAGTAFYINTRGWVDTRGRLF